MAKAVLEAKVNGLGNILRVDAQFGESLKSLRNEGVKYLISARDLAYSRIQKGKRNSLSRSGSYTREVFLYASNSPVLLVPSLLTLNPRLATELNRKGSHTSSKNTRAYDKAYAQAKKDKIKEPEKREVLILPSRDHFSISRTENFEVLQGLLKDQAEAYLEFNGQNIPVYLENKYSVDCRMGTLMTQLWFWDLRHGSHLISGGDYYVYYSDVVRGVQAVTGEASLQKISEGYNPKLVQKYLSILQGVREGRLPVSKLDKMIKDFEGMK